MTEMAKSRDEWILEGVQNLLPNLQNAIDLVTEGSKNLLNSNKANLVSAFQARVQPYIQAAQQIITNADNLKQSFADFQTKRATCYATLLDIQGSAFCLACDSTYADRGVNSDGTINVGTDLCTRVKDDCFDFLRASLKQSPFVALKKIVAGLNAYRNMSDDLTGRPRQGTIGQAALGADDQTTSNAASSLSSRSFVGPIDPTGPLRQTIEKASTVFNSRGSVSKPELEGFVNSLITLANDANIKITTGPFAANLTVLLTALNNLLTVLNKAKSDLSGSSAANPAVTSADSIWSSLQSGFNQWKTDYAAAQDQLDALKDINYIQLAK